MLEPYSSDLLWIVILGFFIAFFLAFGVGANDVANTFGTSVGSEVLTLKQACLLATIFEILGALLMGYKVSDTVRKTIFDIQMYEDDEKVLMMGNMAALLGSASWNLLATFLRLPISGTHSIVGAVLGFTVVAKGFRGIHWKALGFIVSSWFLSPLLSGLLSTAIFLFVRRFILNKKNDIESGLRLLPFFYGFTIFINIFSVLHDGSSLLYFDRLSWWVALIIAIAIGVTIAVCIRLFLIPKQRIQIEELKKKLPEQQNIISVEMNSMKTPNVENSDAREKNTFLSVDEKSEEESEKPEISHLFKALQILTAIFGSFAHGGNDVSNAIAPLISLWIIYIEGSVSQKGETPLWLLLYGGVGISAGLWILGRKVIQTIGKDLTKITPTSGFTIEIGSATTVLLASKIGLPISTTHCKVGSVVCVGGVRNKAGKRVDFSLLRSIVLAWFVTLPLTALLSAATMAILYAVAL